MKKKRYNPDWQFKGVVDGYRLKSGESYCRAHRVLIHGGTCQQCDRPAFCARNSGVAPKGYSGDEPDMIVGVVQQIPEDK